MSEIIGKISSKALDFTVNMESSNDYRDTFLDCFNTMSTESLDKIRLDLMHLSNFVYAADRRIPRSSSEDGWTRDFELTITMLYPNVWERASDTLVKLLSFLTGDNWKFIFEQRELSYKEEQILINQENLEDSIFPNHICMFSGGLDSFIGAIDILSSDNDTSPLFLSHYGGGSKGTKDYQDILRANLIEEFEMIDEDNFIAFYSAAMKSLTDWDEPTTRSRSFMFFSHAVVLVQDGGVLTIPENGFVSLNIPLFQSRNGSSSTRTTHPYYLDLFQKLLEEIGIDISIKNPYQFSTKGEMIFSCMKPDFLRENITSTMSCSHPEQARWSKFTEPIHCGYCLPCTIRRSSILASGVRDMTMYRYKRYENKTGKETLNALRIAVYDYHQANPLARVQYSGPLVSNLNKYVKVYSKGMGEIDQLINEVKNNEVS